MAAPITNATGAVFYIAEIQTFAGGGGGAPLLLTKGWNTAPWNVLSLNLPAVSSSGLIVASDIGYRTHTNDPQGVIPYPPVLTQAFQIDREVPVDPLQTSAAATWGNIVLANDDGRFDAVAAQWNVDGRNVTIKYGVKTWDDARGIWLDPPYGALSPVFSGVATPWFLDSTTLTIPIRDATYWIERPLQSNLYGGSGQYDGSLSLAGLPKPKTRGGTAANPVMNVTPTLIDPINLIYQYSDGPGTVVNLYEGAAKTILFSSDATNLYPGVTAAGHYRTDNSRAAFQLGSTPVHAITADVTGAFPIAGAINTISTIALFLLTEDMQLPAGNIDVNSFVTAANLFPYVGGIYFDPATNVDGVTGVSAVLEGFGAKLISDRTGKLRCFVLRSVPTFAIQAAQIVSLTGAAQGLATAHGTAAASSIGASKGAAAGHGTAAAVSGGATTTTFDDEFSTLNTSVWILADNPGSGKISGGYQNNSTWVVDPTAGGASQDIYTISGGKLALKMKAPGAGGSSTNQGGRMATEGTFAQKYGYFEASIGPIPVVGGTGFAFWMFAANTDGVYQEIDIVEMAVSDPSNYDAKASLWETDETLNDGVDNFSVDLTVAHTWGVDWQPTGVSFYLDRVLQGTFSEKGYTKPMFMLLEFTNGGSWTGDVNTGSLPLSALVDYVRVWPKIPF